MCGCAAVVAPPARLPRPLLLLGQQSHDHVYVITWPSRSETSFGATPRAGAHAWHESADSIQHLMMFPNPLAQQVSEWSYVPIEVLRQEPTVHQVQSVHPTSFEW